MDLQLTGKRALVTGSTAGIGLAIAESLAAEGAHVIVNGRTSARVEHARDAIRAKLPSATVEGVAADIGNDAGIDALIAKVPELDILINNAGIFTAKPLADLRTEDWLTMFSTNVVSGAALSQRYLPGMLSRNAGRIVFISSESGLQIPAEMIHYGISKAAQTALARGLAELTRGSAVTVNTVLAGPTYSEGVSQFVGELAAQQKKTPSEVEKDFFNTIRPTSLVQRFASTEEIARVVTFLASPVASIVSGAAVRAEGGLLKGVY